VADWLYAEMECLPPSLSALAASELSGQTVLTNAGHPWNVAGGTPVILVKAG